MKKILLGGRGAGKNMAYSKKHLKDYNFIRCVHCDFQDKIFSKVRLNIPFGYYCGACERLNKLALFKTGEKIETYILSESKIDVLEIVE